MTAMQMNIVDALRRAGRGLSLDELAWRLQLGEGSRLAVYSSLASLRKQGKADYYRRGEDRWSPQIWYLTKEVSD